MIRQIKYFQAVIRNNSFSAAAEGVRAAEHPASSIARIPLFRGNSQIRRNYCAFWKKDNSGYYVEEFADILKRKFN